MCTQNCGLNLNASAASVWEPCKCVQYSVCVPVYTVSLEKCYCAESLWSKCVCKHFLRERWGLGVGGRGGEGPMLTTQYFHT